MNPSLRLSAKRIEAAQESHDRDYPQLLEDAHKLLQYVRQCEAIIKAGDTAIRQLETAANAQDKETQWIKVEDELPDKYQTVLAYGPGEDESLFTAYLNQSNTWSDLELEGGRVYPTHWMELPEPPQ